MVRVLSFSNGLDLRLNDLALRFIIGRLSPFDLPGGSCLRPRREFDDVRGGRAGDDRVDLAAPRLKRGLSLLLIIETAIDPRDATDRPAGMV